MSYYKDTSREANETTEKPTDRELLMLALARHGALTAREATAMLKKDQFTGKGSIPARLKDLELMGLVEIHKHKRKTKNGTHENLYYLSEAGRNAQLMGPRPVLKQLGKRLQELERWRADYLKPHRQYAEMTMDYHLSKEREKLGL